MSIEHRDRPPHREPIMATVDLSAGWDKESMRDILIARLKELNIYQPNLLFRGFDGSQVEIVKRYGTDHPNLPTLFCSEEGELADEHGMKESALDYALDQEKAGLAVYEGSKLERDEQYYEYRAKQGTSLTEALLAILTLE